MKIEWIREILRTCRKQHVEFFFKQWAAFAKTALAGNSTGGPMMIRLPAWRRRSLTPSSYYGFGGSLLFNGQNKSSGTGRNVVVLCSLEISRMVCRKRNCSAIGSLLMIAAACTIFSAA